MDCEISPSEVDHYNDFIRKNPYHGPWQIDYNDERVRDVVGTGARRSELADCFPALKQAATQEDVEDVAARSLEEVLQEPTNSTTL